MATKPALLTLNLPDFIYFLRSRGISTFHAVYKPDARKFATSHSALDPIVEYFRNEGRDFDSHEGIFGQVRMCVRGDGLDWIVFKNCP